MTATDGFRLLGVLFVASCVGSESPDEPSGFLDLVEDRRLTLPVTAGQPEGMFFHDERLVVWTDASVYMESDDRTELSRLRLSLVTSPVSLWIDNDTLVILDGRSQAVLRFASFQDATGSWLEPVVMERLPPHLAAGRLLGAAKTTCGVLVAGLDSSGVAHVHRLMDGEEETVSGPWTEAELERGVGWMIGAVEEGMLLAWSPPPFNVYVAHCDGGAKAAYALPEGLELDSGGLWRGLPPVAGPTFALRTIADARSNRRVIITYDADRRPQRARWVDTPLGFAAVHRDGQFVAAMHALNRPEVVVYRVIAHPRS